MVKEIICFGLKNQESNPKIREGELVGIAIQTWRNYIWSSCGYLMVANDPEAILNLEKRRNQEHFFLLNTEMRVEEFTENVIISDDGKEIRPLGRKKIYVEDPDWGKKIKLIHIYRIKYFVPKRVVKNENNLLHIEIEPMEFYQEGVTDKLIFKGGKINQYRDLVVGNLGKEFKMSQSIFDTPPEINTDKWDEKEKIKLAEEKSSDRPEKTIPELRKSLTEYYREKNIKTMKLSDEDQKFLDIVFNDGEKQTSDIFSSRRDRQKLEQVKIWLKSNGKKSLDYSELIGLDPELNKWKKKLRQYMEQNNIEEIILEGRNKVICKKCNNSGSLSFGGDFIPLSGNNELPQIPEASRTKINGVDIGLFFEKIGKNSVSRQELGINKTGVDKNNFDWTPWLIGGGVFISALILAIILFRRNWKTSKQSSNSGLKW